MSTNEKITELRSLQSKADAIRRDLGISPPGTVTFLAPRGTGSDEEVLVQADGFGGATTCTVQGNYPVDYVTKFERFFPSEEGAEAAAEELNLQGTNPG